MQQVIINDTKDQALLKKIIQDFVNDPGNEKKHKIYLENPDIASNSLAWLYCRFVRLQDIETLAMINRVNKREPAYTFNANEVEYIVVPVLKQYADKPEWELQREEIKDLWWRIQKYHSHVSCYSET